MRIDIRTKRIDIDAEVRAYVDRRLRFALTRFGGRVDKVTVRFEDTNGARGGVDKQCQISVTLRPSGSVLVEDVDADLHVVIDRTAERVSRVVARDLQRRREAGRP